MIAQDDVLTMFQQCGALLEGHFVLTSGLHSGQYVEKFRVLERPDLTSKLCGEFAERFKNDRIQTVVGPVTGGMILAFETARQLGVRSIYAERDSSKPAEGMIFRRGFTLKEGERVVIVEDILTTGRSIKEVLAAVRGFRAEVVGIGVLVDRRDEGATTGSIFDVRLEALSRLVVKSYPPSNCPLCRQGLPAIKPGSRPTVP